MGKPLTDLQRQLVGTFFEEATEALANIEAGLLALEGDPGRSREIVDDVFRAAHTLKGGAATFGMTTVAELAHEAETLLDLIRSATISISPEIVAVLLDSVDALRDLCASAQQDRPSRIPTKNTRLQGIK